VVETTGGFIYTGNCRLRRFPVKPILLLDKSLQVEVSFSKEDCGFEDNICILFEECCPEDEKVFKHGESHIFVTCAQARELAAALTAAIEESENCST
jgi:hypothetical protein